jgi:two-component system response regulator NreC
MVRILVADDHELVRQGLIRVLTAAHTDWEIVAEASGGASAIARGTALKPDVAILDLSMPDANGLEVAQKLLEAAPKIKILVLTMHAAAPIMTQLRKAGVHAYLAKNEAPTKLVNAVERILAGEPFFASTTAHRSAEELQAGEYVPVPFLLTPRELEVMKMLANGLSNKQVAGELEMSVRTAETHHANILAKLKIDSLGELVRLAVRDGVVSVNQARGA